MTFVIYIRVHLLDFFFSVDMGEKLGKFLLLTWKIWVLQYRRPLQTLVPILLLAIFSGLLVVLRGQAEPVLKNEKIFSPFCTFPIALNLKTASGEILCPSIDNIPSPSISPT
ncbi:unnamed protein product [Psylliodes chrysocephalus]|uniref:Uncharacterized protein n=1 Tax=Psylliodes chrysocephalus TaxID=3402493 RepID=A0A9P0CYM7_9CUCU|nr:unnamed protein product [Psylliodes chrysocephala]